MESMDKLRDEVCSPKGRGGKRVVEARGGGGFLHDSGYMIGKGRVAVFIGHAGMVNKGSELGKGWGGGGVGA